MEDYFSYTAKLFNPSATNQKPEVLNGIRVANNAANVSAPAALWWIFRNLPGSGRIGARPAVVARLDGRSGAWNAATEAQHYRLPECRASNSVGASTS